MKFAITVQSAVTGFVMNTVFTSEPPQVPPTPATWKPEEGVNVKLVVSPSSTVCGVEGAIVPEGVPTLGVTVCVTTIGAKFAMTVQSSVTGSVVNTLLTSVPPQVPPTLAISKPDDGVSVKLVVSPSSTVCGVEGAIVPDGVPTLGVTVCVVVSVVQLGNLKEPMRVCQLPLLPLVWLS
jgi:RNase P/RNase MRP subunit p29